MFYNTIRLPFRVLVGSVLAIAIVATASGAWAAPAFFIASEDSDSVLHYDASTGTFLGAFVPPGAGGLAGPIGLAFGPDGNLYVVSHDTNSVLRYDGASGAPLPAPGQPGAVFVPAGSGGMSDPQSLEFFSDGNIYVATGSQNSVMRFSGATGAPLPAPGKTGALFVSPGDGGLTGAWHTAEDPIKGVLYTSSTSTGSVLSYNLQTGAFDGAFVPSGIGGLQAGWDVIVPPPPDNEYVYVGDIGAHDVKRYDRITGAPAPAPGQAGATFAAGGGLSTPWGTQFGLDGNLYVASYDTHSVLRYDRNSGAFLGVFIPPGSGGLDGPAYFKLFPIPEPAGLFLLGMWLGVLGLRARARIVVRRG
jgi:DNA-binding beta-propeller fold protein YncE